jgi:hypothetical protein
MNKGANMSAMGAIYSNMWEFVENPKLDRLNDSINGYTVEFERYQNRQSRRDLVEVSFYKNGLIQSNMSVQYWLDEFHAIYRG